MTGASPSSHLRAFRGAVGMQWRCAPWASAGALALSLLTGTGPALGAWLIKQLLDELAKGGAADRARSLALAGAAAGAGALFSAVLAATHYLDTVIRRRLSLGVDRELFAKVAQLPGLRFFEDPHFQGQLRLAERAATEAPHQISELSHSIVRAAVTVGSLLGILFAVSPLLAGLLLAVGALGLAAQGVRSRADVRLIERMVEGERWRELYRALLLDVRAAKEIRLFDLGELLLGRMSGAAERSIAQELGLERRTAALQLLLSLATAGVSVASALLVTEGALRGRFHLGDVTLLFAAVVGIQGAFANLLMMLGLTSRTLLMLRSYSALMALPGESARPAPPLPPLRKGIELRDVWFRYAEDGPWILRGVSLSIPPGGSLGLVGANGAGKSTLVKLLCRFYEPERGQILWDGVDVRQLDRRAVRRRIGATFQDFMTYELSAQDNIGLGDLPHLHDLARIRAAARSAELDEALCALPRGYQTLLSRALPDEHAPDQPGSALSGGQWQRVALARALLRQDVDLLILDEPSAALDAAAEHRIHQTLRGYGQGRARLLISHRLSALRDADEIAVLEGGRVIERGPHPALMAAGGEYARLFSLQAAGYQAQPSAVREVG